MRDVLDVLAGIGIGMVFAGILLNTLFAGPAGEYKYKADRNFPSVIGSVIEVHRFDRDVVLYMGPHETAYAMYMQKTMGDFIQVEPQRRGGYAPGVDQEA